MDWETALKAVTAVAGAGTTVGALYRWARAQGRADALAEEATRALKAKNAEIVEMKETHGTELAKRDEEIAELKAENRRLWSMFDALTSPREGR